MSFSWGIFQWFYSAGKDCGFKAFPTMGLEAYYHRYSMVLVFSFQKLREYPRPSASMMHTTLQVSLASSTERPTLIELCRIYQLQVLL